MALDQDPTAKPQPPADVEGFLQQEARRADENAQEIADVTGTETTHAPEEPGVFSSSETGTVDTYAAPATDQTGAIIHDSAPEGAHSIAEHAAAYLRKLNDENEATATGAYMPASTTSTALEVAGPAEDHSTKNDEPTRPEHPSVAPTNIIADSGDTIALPQHSEQLNWKPKAEETGLAHGPETPDKTEPNTETAATAKVAPRTDTTTAPPAKEAGDTVVAPPKKSRKGLIGGLVAGVAGLAAVAGLAIPKGSNDTTTPEQVNPNPVPPAGAEASESGDSENAGKPELSPDSTVENGEGLLGFRVDFNEQEPYNSNPDYGVEFRDEARNEAATANNDIRQWGLNVASDALANKSKAGEKIDQNIGVCVSFPMYFDGPDGTRHNDRVFFINPTSYSEGRRKMYQVVTAGGGSGFIVEETASNGERRYSGGFQDVTVDKISGFAGPDSAVVKRMPAGQTEPVAADRSPATIEGSDGTIQVEKALFVHDADELNNDAAKRLEFCEAALKQANTPKG